LALGSSLRDEAGHLTGRPFLFEVRGVRVRDEDDSDGWLAEVEAANVNADERRRVDADIKRINSYAASDFRAMAMRIGITTCNPEECREWLRLRGRDAPDDMETIERLVLLELCDLIEAEQVQLWIGRIRTSIGNDETEARQLHERRARQASKDAAYYAERTFFDERAAADRERTERILAWYPYAYRSGVRVVEPHRAQPPPTKKRKKKPALFDFEETRDVWASLPPDPWPKFARGCRWTPKAKTCP
jgi:hypothetical protein